MSDYNEAVEQAATALKRGEDANWEMARLTAENTLSRGDAGTQVAKVSMAQWCTDVREASGRRFSASNGEMYKRIWVKWGPVLEQDRPSWTDAYEETQRAPRHEREAQRAQVTVRNLPPERKAEVARELLADPVVAEQIADDITEHVASDPVRTAHVISKRRESDPRLQHIEQPEQRPRRDYDAMVEQWVNLASVTFAAESAGTWKPNEHSEALLYFISQIIGKRSEPTGEKADFVNEKLENLFSEVEAYANSEVS